MKQRILCVILALLMVFSFAGGILASAASEIYYDGEWHTYTGNTFRLKINGETVSCSVPPIVFRDYSVVPARDVFEHLGADVVWYGPEERVTVNLGKTAVVLYINSITAYKNGKAETMPIAPKIINGKTMIPVRYVAESLGFDVQFDSKTDTILIETAPKQPTITPQPPAVTPTPPTAEPSISLSSYKGTESKGVFSMRFTFSKAVSDISDFVLKEPNRIVLDLGDVKLGSGIGSSTYNAELVTAVRFGQHGAVLRIVLDAQEGTKYTVSSSGKTITVAVGKTGTSLPESNITVPDNKEDENKGNDEETQEEEKPAITIPNFDHIDIKPSRSITIDPGHGGSDPGATYTDEEGNLWKETDINLAIALKVRDILEAKGVRVVMTRTKEETVVRRSRPELANEEKTALFISIHTNSVAENDKANGIETWGGLEIATSKTIGGVTDESFAKNVQSAVIKQTKASNRGVKDSLDLTVLLYSAMPSILIEVGFITNEQERENLFSNSYRNKLAQGIAEGILKTFEDMGV